MGLPFIILIECGFVVCDKNKVKVSPGDRKARGKQKDIPIVVPHVKVFFIFLPTCNKCSSIRYHVFSLMTINIHPISLLFISPVQLFQPVVGHLFSDCWLANSDIGHIDVSILCTLLKPKLKTLQDIFILKDHPP